MSEEFSKFNKGKYEFKESGIRVTNGPHKFPTSSKGDRFKHTSGQGSIRTSGHSKAHQVGKK